MLAPEIARAYGDRAEAIMGVFDVHCAVSGLALASSTRLSTRLILLASEGESGDFAPIALPVCGSYDRYGKIDSIEEDPSTRAIAALRKRMVFPEKLEKGSPLLESMFAEMNRGASEDLWARWDGHRVSFALVDDGVYRAVVATVAAGGRPAWDAVGSSQLARMGLDELVVRAFARSPLARAIIDIVPADDRKQLEPALVDFVQFLAFGAKLALRDALDGEQYCGLEGEFGCAERVARARRELAAYPPILEAVSANEAYWHDVEAAGLRGELHSELDEEDEDDGEGEDEDKDEDKDED